MQQTYLGPTGLVVSNLCLGTMTFGGAADLETARAIVDRFRDAGGTFFDTANIYTDGRSEEILGKVVAGDRDDVVIATKGYGGVGPGPNDRSACRKHLRRAVDDSLGRLGTDYIDLYQLHSWDPTTPLDETLSTLEDLVRAGKLLYVGVSNYLGWQLERAVRLQEAAGYDRFATLQPQYSLVERQVEFETLPAARANGMAILPWSPLAAGFLTGKYRRGEDDAGKGRFGQFIANMSDRGWATLDAVRAVADERGVAPATVALGWLLAKPGVLPIVGATRPDHLDATLPAADLVLSGEEVHRLDEASEPPRGYPFDWAAAEQRPERDVA